MERPVDECVVDSFMLRPCRLHPLDFNIPANRGWRPKTQPIIVIDEETSMPVQPVTPVEHAITKVTGPSDSGDPRQPISKFILKRIP